MIYFITNCPKHIEHYTNNVYDGIELLEDDDFSNGLIKKYISELDIKEVGFDKETNGLDAWGNSTILDIIGTAEHQFVFHTAFCPNFKDYIEFLRDLNFTLLGHNIKFDLKFLMTELGLIWRGGVYDTMICEQRLFMGSGMRNGLADLVFRYIDVYPDAMDKSIRDEFIGANRETFFFKPKHIRYAGGDVEHLFPIKDKQEETMAQYKMQFLIKEIEFPLIHILGKAEITGFDFNLEKWLEIYEANAKRKFELECELDIEVRRLRDLLCTTNRSRIGMIGGKWDNVRKRTIAHDLFNEDGTTNVLDLFGEPMSSRTYTGTKTKVNKTPNNIAYTSDTQIIEIFAKLEQALPTKQGSDVVPTFNKKGKIDKTFYSFQTGEPVLVEYLTNYPNSVMRPFIELLLKHRGVTTACNNFGINFKAKINPITGKLHTIFRQCAAKTGRFQCGGGRLQKDKPNFQNIPSKASYAIDMRNCFMAKPGNSMGTHDLGGAELIIMCSLSQDMKLLEISMNDMHSYVAQGCWRLIYKHRAENKIKTINHYREIGFSGYNDVQMSVDIEHLLELATTYIVSKSINKSARTNHKPITFGVIYGMYAAKAGKTLNITKEEGQIVIDFIKQEFPDVIRMVEAATRFARKHGYLILNERTNSRAWFPNIIQVLKGNIPQDDIFRFINKELSEARNKKIQGTQADMIKEITVEIQDWLYKNNLEDEITLLSWVHDEIVDDHPRRFDGKSVEWTEWVNQGNELHYNDKVYNNFPDIKRQIMRDTANKYLHNVTMDADYDVEPFWTK
jgi:DNA polymerase I-like protein with 3'-5' exonuclease and polymerase domains